MTAREVIDKIIDGQRKIHRDDAETFAPANIALCKYWGKRDTELNLPLTSSLSMSLGQLGTRSRLSASNSAHDSVSLNGQELAADNSFVTRLTSYLDHFRPQPEFHYRLETTNTIPTAAGFASSASGFASLVLALNQLHDWNLPQQKLSILARIGSGSACRSFWQGFVEWQAGSQSNGMDSFAKPIAGTTGIDLKIGLLVLTDAKKPIGSREAMQRTVATSQLYKSWPAKVATDLKLIKEALRTGDFELLGTTAESNALAMHATMAAALPPVLYWLPESVAVMHKVWQCRQDGIPVYFTMDAGPNVKLLFQEHQKNTIQQIFPTLQLS